jgi:mannose-6-phosphate isomerase-like protein (cupin superfamily)
MMPLLCWREVGGSSMTVARREYGLTATPLASYTLHEASLATIVREDAMVEVSARPVPLSPVEVVNPVYEPGDRNVKRLARSELINVLLHRWDTGGEVALHHHTDGDATWVVLEGEVTFHGENDDILARAGQHEAVVVPRNTAYWFINSGTSPLVMYRISAKVGGITAADDRVYHKRD